MIYLSILLLTMLFVIKYDFCYKPDSRYNIFKILILFVSLIAGFRYMIGADTINYYDFFKTSVTLDYLNKRVFENTRYGVGYTFFVSLIKSISNHFFILQLIVAFILNITLYKFITKNTERIFATILIYFLLNYLEFNTEIQRESIAISLSLIGYMYYERKRYFIAFFFIACAMTFHISAIITVLFPIANKIKFSGKGFFIVLVSLTCVIPSIYIAIPNLYELLSLVLNISDWNIEAYTRQSLDEDLNIHYYILHSIKYIIIPFSIIFYLEKKEQTKFLGFIYLWSILQFLNMYSYGFYRFANYLAPFVWIYYAEFLCSVIKNYLYRLKAVALMIVCVMFLYFYQNILIRHDGGFMSSTQYVYERYFPYKSVFSEKLY